MLHDAQANSSCVLFFEHTRHGRASSLLLLIPTHFSVLRDQFVASQMSGDADGEKRQKLVEAFGKLMTDVKDNLMPKNREKFTQNATVFKNEVKALLV